MKFDWNELMINGYYKTTYDKVGNIPIDDVILDKYADHVLCPSALPDSYKVGVNELIVEVTKELSKVYQSIEPISYDENSPYNVWDGVDSDSATWHNDALEGGNIFMLLYFDNVPEDKGGKLSIKMNDEIVTSLHPQRGDIVFISNEPNVYHIVERSSIKRRLANLTFDCDFLECTNNHDR